MWDSALVHMFYREECFQAKAAQHKVAKRIGTHLISIGFQMVQVLCLLSLASFTCAPWFIPASMLQLVSRPWQRRFPFNQNTDFGLTALARPSLARPWQRRFPFNQKNDFGLTALARPSLARPWQRRFAFNQRFWLDFPNMYICTRPRMSGDVTLGNPLRCDESWSDFQTPPPP